MWKVPRRLWPVRDRIADVDKYLKRLSTVRRHERGQWWHESVEDLLANRCRLMAERDAPFVVTDKRKVRG